MTSVNVRYGLRVVRPWILMGNMQTTFHQRQHSGWLLDTILDNNPGRKIAKSSLPNTEYVLGWEKVAEQPFNLPSRWAAIRWPSVWPCSDPYASWQ